MVKHATTCNQIYHTLVNRKWWDSLKDVRVYRGADVGSDHNLAISTIKLSLAALRRQKKQAKYDSAKLLERDILDCFDALLVEGYTLLQNWMKK